MSVFAFIFIYKLLPETKNKSLEEILDLFTPQKIRKQKYEKLNFKSFIMITYFT